MPGSNAQERTSGARAVLCRRDRGQLVGDRQGYCSLAASPFPTADVIVRHDLLHVPYAHAIVDATG